MNTTLSFTHRFVPASAEGEKPLLLLHGTGGDENDLLDLGRALAPHSALLSPRGRVLENGMPRFFKRLSEGVFDEADLLAQTKALAAFIAEAREAYALEAPLAVGFSNGANIAASLLMQAPNCLAGALLLRPMQPYRVRPQFRLNSTPILMLSGAFDPIVGKVNVDGLAEAFTEAGADLRYETLPTGHALSQMDLTIAKEWLSEHGRA
ncbi:alpha/beta hydrolase [Limoniibacter endophyticus]|uniref:Hydrolase n=1 Tax=Limoniibacter endophyticus TaxID=1565040 RepID=A0A8J3DQD6_9HYPH|nr:alpha/beta hydrolase [Limoniibacter endophyticus]GHC71846.1 hydrolase [Limoniibacter endophyticus]